MALGFTGSYGRVAAFAREWRVDRQREQQTTGAAPSCRWPSARRSIPVRLERGLRLAGRQRDEASGGPHQAVAQPGLPGRAYLLQTHEMLFDAHWHGVPGLRRRPRRGIYDNMKTAVDRVGTRQGPTGQRPLPRHDQPLCIRAGVLQSRLRVGERQVEKNVQDARPGCGSRCRASRTSAALNAWLEQRCIATLGARIGAWRLCPAPIADAWAEERASIDAAAGRPFDGFVEQSKRVSPTCLITFERNRYGACPHPLPTGPVSLQGISRTARRRGRGRYPM